MRISAGKLTRRGRGGFTLIEMMVAVAIGSIVGLGLYSFTVMAMRMDKGIFHQQISLLRSKKTINSLNREIHLAAKDLILWEATNAATSNKATEVRFNYFDELDHKHAFRMFPGPDGNYATPRDNQFLYDPDVDTASDEVVLATMVTSIDNLNTGEVFTYAGGLNSPLQVKLRLGDPVTTRANTSVRQNSDRFTGKGLQGTDINIYVTPRNPKKNTDGTYDD